MYPDFWDWTYILLIPGLLLGLWAQSKVNHAYRKYSRVGSRMGRPASEVVADLLRRNGNGGVRVAAISGELTDNYNPKTETLSLSQGVYNSSSIAALGIAAHEAGHAMQKRDDYAPMRLRTAVVPVVNIGSTAYMPLFVAGLIFSWQPLIYLGILCFSLSVIFSLITLPVEFDAEPPRCSDAGRGWLHRRRRGACGQVRSDRCGSDLCSRCHHEHSLPPPPHHHSEGQRLRKCEYCEGGGFSEEKSPPSRSLPKRQRVVGNAGGEAASLREAPLPPDPSLPKSGWRLAWGLLHRWFRLSVGCGFLRLG